MYDTDEMLAGHQVRTAPLYTYDLKSQPPWFDFVTFLAGCATHAGGRFDLAILAGERNDGLPVSRVTREGMVHTIMLPATRLYPVRELSLFPATEPQGGIRREYVGRCLLQGKPIPSLKVPAWAKEYVARRYAKNTVVISLREASHNAHRNSDLKVWTRVARQLMSMGYRPVFLRDTAAIADLASPLSHLSAWDCSHNLYLRAALHEHAVMNLGTMNGTCTMATHNTRANYCFFGMGLPCAHLSPQWMLAVGYEWGKDLPWALPGQRVIWEPGTPERILEEFEATSQDKHDLDHFPPPEREFVLISPTQAEYRRVKREAPVPTKQETQQEARV